MTRDVEVFLGAKIVVEHGLVHAGRIGNRLGPRAVEPICRKLLGSSRKDPLLGRDVFHGGKPLSHVHRLPPRD